MIIAILGVLGLCWGSFVNAYVWRIHEQSKMKNKKAKNLSVLKGRSMCVHCKHELAAKDLVPLLSWLLLRGKCRYCHKAISWQYPLVEALTAALFIASYLWWPMEWDAAGITNFVGWLVMITGFMALMVYDFRWMLLPNRIVYPLMVITGVLLGINLAFFDGGFKLITDAAIAVVIAGGIFYALFAISSGKWIGGGDVKLGILIGLLLADPFQAFLVLLGASLLGTVVVLPGMALKKVDGNSRIPFGPFLIIAAILARLFGEALISWYKRTALLEM